MSDDKCPLSWLVRDPYTEARIFYGPAFEAIAKAEKDARDFQRLRSETAPSRIDDVAGQKMAPLSVMDYTKSRTRFAWLPVKLWSGRYQRCGGGWLCWVREYWTDGEWKAFRMKDAP